MPQEELYLLVSESVAIIFLWDERVVKKGWIRIAVDMFWGCLIRAFASTKTCVHSVLLECKCESGLLHTRREAAVVRFPVAQLLHTGLVFAQADKYNAFN